MSTAASSAASPRRKVASWFNAAILALALTACCVLAVLITTRAHYRKDVTATRQHELSPRTAKILAGLDRDLTLVIAADMNNLDGAARQRTLDVIEQFAGASKRLKVNYINTSEAKGQSDYEQVLADLARRDKPTVDAAVAAVTAAISKSESVTAALDAVQKTLEKVKDQLVAGEPGMLSAQYLQPHAAILRVAMQDLRVAANNAKARIESPDPLVPVPAVDKALAELKKPVADASAALSTLANDFDSLAKDPRAGEKDKAAAGLVLPQLRQGRDAAGTLAADLGAVPTPRVLGVARALQLRRAAMVIDNDARPGSGVGIAAIDADTLLAVNEPGTGESAGVAPDYRARTEDLITGAIIRMVSGVRPVVCVVHGGPRSLAAADWPTLQLVRQQLSMSGIELTEWATAVDREIPTQVASDSPSRPVVFVAFTPAAGARETPQSMAAGIAAYSKALDLLVASGRNLLLSVNVSQVPASGSPDPITECLKPLGIQVDSGRPILETRKVETRTVATPFQDNISDPHAAHAVSGAIRGLRLLLQWPVAITAQSPVPGVRTEPVVTVPASSNIWAESEWQEFYRGIAQVKGDFRRISNPPMKDSPRDGTAPGEAWTLALAVEHPTAQHPRQRLVIVGSSGWFIDDLVGLQTTVYNRTVPVFPGNMQLLESSIHWLAGQDDQILRGASLTNTATIPLLSPAAQSWLRWLLIAIMPALALAAGVAYRALRP